MWLQFLLPFLIRGSSRSTLGKGGGIEAASAPHLNNITLWGTSSQQIKARQELYENVRPKMTINSEITYISVKHSEFQERFCIPQASSMHAFLLHFNHIKKPAKSPSKWIHCHGLISSCILDTTNWQVDYHRVIGQEGKWSRSSSCLKSTWQRVRYMVSAQ